MAGSTDGWRKRIIDIGVTSDNAIELLSRIRFAIVCLLSLAACCFLRMYGIEDLGSGQRFIRRKRGQVKTRAYVPMSRHNGRGRVAPTTELRFHLNDIPTRGTNVEVLSAINRSKFSLR
jgi:hypothetical protein